MSLEPEERMETEDPLASDDDAGASPSGDDAEHDAAVDLMVVSRARRANAGSRMNTLIAKTVEQEEEEEAWGDEWEEAPNEEEFVGDDANDQDDFNMDSSSTEDEDDGGDDDAGEKELRRAEQQERAKKRKTATNPFAAKLAVAARKEVKLDVPSTQTVPAPRPKKKSERASWIPTPEDGPTRMSSRRQTVANKDQTMAKLKEKDTKRAATLAMMKAAEERKEKDKPKPMTQAERLAEAARVERVNSRSLHRWEEAEEQRAAERQAKLDAMKNRQIEGPFIRYYSGPAIWVDDKLKFTGKDAPKIEDLDEKLNKDIPPPSESEAPKTETLQHAQIPRPDLMTSNSAPSQQTQASVGSSREPLAPQSQPPQSQNSQTSQPSQPPGQDHPISSHTMPYPSSIMFAPPQNLDSFLFGIEQYAPLQASFSHPSLGDPALAPQAPLNAQSLLAQFQHRPPPPPAPPRRKLIRRAVRNLIILNSFSNLDNPLPQKSRYNTSASKDKNLSSLVNISSSLFGWSTAEATMYVTAMLNAPKTKAAKGEGGLPKPARPLCAISNRVARYRDPGTGIAYRDARAFGVVRGVVGGGVRWSASLGCFVGGAPGAQSARPKLGGIVGVKPAMGVPKRFLEMGTGPLKSEGVDMSMDTGIACIWIRGSVI
ncbi:YL1-domain-containing protein [Zopfia rhizophila CBS 207.26]|uniref:YL1-domain-containing protein n=1 Tax=Zopfia rhizophila CBS 207.26 TaxID=1314779 RepID=A0A6A6EL22_9PEZI|nr:YL1-domain-containing protein [Zopfia rhizophila CBS 207.26]